MRKVAIIVASDTCYRKEAVDTSGEAIASIVKASGYEVDRLVIVPDELETIVKELESCVKDSIPLVLTTGGTGFSPRDVTPEATKRVIEKEALGIAEAIRSESMKITRKAMLSRATAGIKDRTLIINLPGSEKAVKESLDIVLDTITHGLDVLLGSTSNCGR